MCATSRAAPKFSMVSTLCNWLKPGWMHCYCWWSLTPKRPSACAWERTLLITGQSHHDVMHFVESVCSVIHIHTKCLMFWILSTTLFHTTSKRLSGRRCVQVNIVFFKEERRLGNSHWLRERCKNYKKNLWNQNSHFLWNVEKRLMLSQTHSLIRKKVQ